MAAAVGASADQSTMRVADVHRCAEPCVLVVDYAETRSELVGLLDDVAADEDGPELRVVLLARSAGEWWQQLLASAEEQTAALAGGQCAVMLGPVRAAGGAQEVFDDAVTAFAQKVGENVPDARLTLSDPDPVVLVVHAAALLAVVDYATGGRRRHQAVSGSGGAGGSAAGMRPGTGRARRLAVVWTWI